MRKGDPIAALYYGLGYADARLLPGRFGCFLLDPAEVRAALADLDHLPLAPRVSLDTYTARTRAWLFALCDDPDLDPLTLLDGPLRALRSAAASGQGAVGVMQWF